MNPASILKRAAVFGILLALCTPIMPTWANSDMALEKILAQSSAPFGAYALNKGDIAALYQARAFNPIWNTETQAGRDGVKAFLSSMKEYTAYHGIDPDLIPEAMILDSLQKTDQPESLVNAEILMTDTLIKLARRITGEGVTLSHIYVNWPFEGPQHDVIPELSDAISKNRLSDYFTSLPPTDLDYARLSSALKEYRALKEKGGWQPIPKGETIREGDTDPRVPAIAARLLAEGYALPSMTDGVNPHLYTAEIKKAVSEYQVRNSLEADGNFGSKTQAAMSMTVDERIDQIAATMERKRHMPRTYPDRYAVVNIANASVRIIENGQTVYHEPVIVGRRDRKTPFIQSDIRSVIFNPAWHVPAKIAREDILPKLRKDPLYLEKMGFVINDSEDDPHGTMIDWNGVNKSDFNFRLRQSPGAANSLGRIKFDFDNPFAVYMHGTPHEELFVKAARQLSSGCIRLKDPEQFATFVLAGNTGEWTAEKAQEEIDKGRTRWLTVVNQLPLFIIYDTAFFPTPEGPIHFAPDVYNYDRLLMDALKRKDN